MFRQLREDGGSLKTAGIVGGSAMFLIILGGFGMLARLEIHGGFPGWIYAKLALWVVATLALGAALRRKMPSAEVPRAFLTIGTLAAIFALWKPF